MPRVADRVERLTESATAARRVLERDEVEQVTMRHRPRRHIRSRVALTVPCD